MRDARIHRVDRLEELDKPRIDIDYRYNGVEQENKPAMRKVYIYSSDVKRSISLTLKREYYASEQKSDPKCRKTGA